LGYTAPVILYSILCLISLAYASNPDSVTQEDHNHERLLVPYLPDALEEDVGYEAQFYGADRSIIGRLDPDIMPLPNNRFDERNIVPGATPQYYVFTKDSSTSGNTLYITLNTCLQPSNPNDPTGSKGAPPPVEVYVSTSAQNQRPGSNQPSSAQTKTQAVGGFVGITLQPTSDVFIGVSAPNTTTFTQGVYSVQIAVSIDAPFHTYNSTQPNLNLIDSDASSALLAVTVENSTYWNQTNPPQFGVFAYDQTNTAFEGIQNSYCGLKHYAQLVNNGVSSTIMNMQLGSMQSRQQFYFQGLNGSSSYYGALALNGNATAVGNGVVGGGGHVWKTMNFSTQAGMIHTYSTMVSEGQELTLAVTSPCTVIMNLSFCDTVAYAVPGNTTAFSATALAAFYDSAAQQQYSYFDYAMQQVPCDIESTGQYSLAKNCSDCCQAYKTWLCSVLIPRCQDYSNTTSYQVPRGVGNSRNPNIDTYVSPGRYNEILPCEDLCYDIVKSCPSSMGFNCPRRGMPQFNMSYGVRPTPKDGDEITCNYPGAIYQRAAGSVLSRHVVWTLLCATVVGALML
jgi:calcium channel MID1